MTTKRHELGWHGALIEDVAAGTVKYVLPGHVMASFNLRIADVTGVSSERAGLLKVRMKVHGQGTVLADLEVGHGTTEKIREWFLARSPASTRVKGGAEAPLIDQLASLGKLFQDGLLTQEEFTAAKRKLIGLNKSGGVS